MELQRLCQNKCIQSHSLEEKQTANLLTSLKHGSCFYLLDASFLDRGMMRSVSKVIEKSLKY